MKKLLISSLIISTIGCYSGRSLIIDSDKNAIKKDMTQAEVRSVMNFDGYSKIKDSTFQTETGESADGYGGCKVNYLGYLPILMYFIDPLNCNSMIVVYDKDKKVTQKLYSIDRSKE